MPVLNAADVLKAQHRAIERVYNVSLNLHCLPDTMTKPDIRQAIQALDAELDARIPQLNAALTANAPAFAAAATPRQKATLLIVTLLSRFNFL